MRLTSASTSTSTRSTGVWENGHVKVGQLWDLYTRYPYLPRLRDHEVLNAGVRGALNHFNWQQDGFALATRYDESVGRYTDLAFYQHGDFGAITDSTLLVKPSRALQQQAETVVDPDVVDPADTESGDERPTIFPKPRPIQPLPPAAPRKKTRFVGVYEVTSELYGRNSPSCRTRFCLTSQTRAAS